MPRTRASRHFRSATVLGVLAAGLLLPAAASADDSPLVAPQFQYATPADANHGPVVSVLQGRFTSLPGLQVVAVADAGANAAGGISPAGVALFGPTETGFDRTADATLQGEEPVAAVAAELEGDGGTSAVVASRTGGVGAAGTLESVHWRAGVRHRTTPLSANPVAVAVGRFLPGRGPVVAVSLATNRIAFYEPHADGFQHVFEISSAAGPLALAQSTLGPGDALMARDGIVGIRLEFEASNDTWTTRLTGRLTKPFGLAKNTIAATLDPYGNHWYATTQNGVSQLNWFDRGLGENSGFLTSTEKFGAPMLMNLYGGAERNVVAALDGQALHALDIPTNRTTQTGITSSTVATAIDVDEDRRDDLVVARDTGVTLYHNETGSYDNRPELDAHALVPSVHDASTGEQVVTARSFDLVVPTNTGDRYQCQVGDGEWVDCVGTDAGHRALSVPEDGRYKLHVRRMVAGTAFWSAEQSIGFRVEAQVTAKPTIVQGPAAVTNTVKYRVTPPAGAHVEFRVDGEHDWRPATTYPDGDAYVGLTNSLQDGEHDVVFRAVDGPSGTPSETVSSHFLLDRHAPAAPAKIAGPAAETAARKATFSFEGEQNATFECRMDQRDPASVGVRTTDPWEPCFSPWTVDDLELGEHVVEVRQTDAAGNHGPAARWTWTVVAPTPDKTVIVTPKPPVTEQPATETPTAPVPASEAPKPTEPKPDAAKPAPAKPEEAKPVTAKLAVGAPAGKGKVPVATATGRRVAVGCAAPGAEGYRCAVKVTRGGETVGEGRRTGAGLVPVSLDKATARKVQRLGGLKVRVTLTVKTADGETSKTQETVRLLPKKVLVVPTDGLFAFDSAVPSKGASALAKQIAGQLDGARTITIVGHTDAKGTAQVNERLGRERAEAFRRLLAKHGFRGRVAVESAGDTKPRASNATEGGRELNRRVEIEVRY